jgi:hypothetical protein
MVERIPQAAVGVADYDNCHGGAGMGELTGSHSVKRRRIS